MPTVLQALKTRSSKRLYSSKLVPKKIQEEILKAANNTPSGANMQPWITYAVNDEKILKNIGDAIISKMEAGIEHDQFVQYYPVKWKNPYKKRRMETGIGLYKHMNVERKDTIARTKMWQDNFRWFGAKTVFFVFTDKDMIDCAQGAFIDCGAYMQSILLCAKEFDLDTCPQASTTEFGNIVAKVLNIPQNLTLLYSIVIGYAEEDSNINSYQPPRVNIKENVIFI